MKCKYLLCLGWLATSMAVSSQPTITLQPTDQDANQGYGATFELRAIGTLPLAYQWYFKSNALTGALSNQLTIAAASPSDAATYFAVVSDATGSVTSRVATLTVVAPAEVFGLNVRLGDDPPQLPVDQRAQGEPHITRSLADPNLLLAVFQEGRQIDRAALGIGYSVSTNGGYTWSRSLVPGISKLTGGSSPFATDPVAGIDLNNNLFLNILNDDAVWVSKSTNRGVSFDKPVAVAIESYVQDKPWMAINTFPDSPHPNRIFVAWLVALSDDSDVQGLEGSFSDDEGKHWSRPRFIVKGRKQGAQPMFLPDGSLAVVFDDLDSGSPIQLVLSPDGGNSFGEPQTVSIFERYDDPKARAEGIMPAAACDRFAGVIYVSYQAKIGQGTNATPKIMFTRSIDRGMTWSQAVPVNDTPGRRSVFTPAIAVAPDGQYVTIVFYDKRNDSSGQGFLCDLYLAQSFDGGQTWQANQRLSEFSTDLRKAPLTSRGYFLGDYIGITHSYYNVNDDFFNAYAYACWIDTRAGQPDPFVVGFHRPQGPTFAAWQGLRFSSSELSDPGVSGPAADPDSDGIPNIGEFEFGLEPRHFDNVPLRIGIGHFWSSTFPGDYFGPFVELRFPLSNLPGPYLDPFSNLETNSIQPVLEYSSDLQKWLNPTEAQLLTPLDPLVGDTSIDPNFPDFVRGTAVGWRFGVPAKQSYGFFRVRFVTTPAP